MIEVDRAMIEEYGIELLQMMENAGRGLARLAAARFLGNSLRGKNVIALTGRDGNGGGALVAARRLHCWGANVFVFVTKPSDAFEGVPAHQLTIVIHRVGDRPNRFEPRKIKQPHRKHHDYLHVHRHEAKRQILAGLKK